MSRIPTSWTAGAALVALTLAPLPSAACVGDCDGDLAVTVDEVVTGVSIALGARPLGECPSFDGNADEQVTVDEIILALNFALAGCPTEEPTPTATSAPGSSATATPSPVATATATLTATATPTRAMGPTITFFGLARADGTVVSPSGTSAEGIPIIERSARAGFLIIVEGRPGASGSPLSQCNSSYDEFSADARPDVQILSNRNLGAGDPAVCDGPQPAPETGFGCGGRPGAVIPIGGIPGFADPDFESPSRAISDALNDFGCRMAYKPPSEPCTVTALGNPRYVMGTNSTDQFCTERTWDGNEPFPRGDTLLTARLRDFAGNLGPPARIIVRIP